jgi:exopolysaccharide production protein ExoY
MGKLEVQTDSEYEFADLVFEEKGFSSGVEASQLPLLAPGPAIHSWRYLHLKRWIDVACALLLAAVSLFPGLLIAALIVLTSKGPVFYSEMRIGRGRKPFRIWKFRSMCHETPWEGVVKSKSPTGVLLQWRVHKRSSDPRVTRIGGFLRRWSLDELPQVLNVLRGEMSLIGPRPVVAEEVPLYGHLQHFYLAATPGLSGLWQISGRSDVSFATRADLDAFYVQNWSLRRDLVIFFQTIPAVLGRVGAR